MSIDNKFEAHNKAGDLIKLKTVNPSLDEYENAERVYGYKVAVLVRESGKKKLLLRQELDKFLKDQGIWSDDDQTRLGTLQKELDNLSKKLQRGGIKRLEGRKIAIRMLDIRGEMFELLTKRQVFDDVTIENQAEKEKRDYIIYASTVREDSGAKYWAAFEDMKDDRDSEIYFLAVQNMTKVLYGVGSDPIEKQFLETKFLLKHKFINDELEFTNPSTGEKCDKEGNVLKIESEEIEEALPFLDDESGQPVILEEIK